MDLMLKKVTDNIQRCHEGKRGYAIGSHNWLTTEIDQVWLLVVEMRKDQGMIVEQSVFS